MFDQHAKLMKVFNDCQQIVGRKKLQKMIFIAKKFHIPFNEKFDFHFYGPYSEELTLQVEELCNLGFVHETKEKKGGYFQYLYELTGAGEEFLKQHEVNLPEISSAMGDLNKQSSRFLELVSTILYFDYLPTEEIVEKVKTVKSKLRFTEEEFEHAFQYIEQLKEKFV
ncbi:YwgA family protein [Bacillus carboniphilus]|uniref:YwgA family protein n=1 Tax=Bacillus carboniphilus TaxID=86663 RepID=A0ABY9JZY6_9BACI|nr:YwgA family protein [Bacillus carboniphilus]WLR44339.1 YwgA family protein [Bacillus carboniphilus]